MGVRGRWPEGWSDPRMRGFRARAPLADAWAWADRAAALGPELVSASEALGRVLAAAIVAERPLPGFTRAAMDGYAVRGEETFGSDAYNPAPLRVVGRSRPGAGWSGPLGPGEAVAIATGAPLPRGADAVLRAEGAMPHPDQKGVILATEPTPPGRHVGRIGEDLSVGAAALAAGRVLRPQDLGLISALGLGAVRVVRRPRVAIVCTGDELLPPGSVPHGCSIADANGPMLAALVTRDGGVATSIGPLRDDREGLRQALIEAARGADAVLVSGGTSAGPEDHAPGLLAELGSLDLHGLALRPASPTGLGWIGAVPTVLLPGNPVSCLCGYDLIAGRVVRRLAGRPGPWGYRADTRPLGAKLVSSLGRVDYARVTIHEDGTARPIGIGGASILSGATRADGFVLVDANSEGASAGTAVQVWLYDG